MDSLVIHGPVLSQNILISVFEDSVLPGLHLSMLNFRKEFPTRTF